MVFRKIVDVLEIRAKSDMLSLVTSVARRKPCERSWIWYTILDVHFYGLVMKNEMQFPPKMKGT